MRGIPAIPMTPWPRRDRVLLDVVSSALPSVSRARAEAAGHGGLRWAEAEVMATMGTAGEGG
mgnify:FL=1